MHPDECEEIRRLEVPGCGLRGFWALHRLRHGTSFGGIRIARYGSEGEVRADAARLARAMTLKCALAGLQGGGAKLVVQEDSALDRPRALEAIGDFIEGLGGRYQAGPDVGTGAVELAIVRRRTRHAVDLSSTGCGDLSLDTALGVHYGMGECLRRIFGVADPAGRVVAIQGLGSVGLHLARLLRAAGARVLGADPDPGRVALALPLGIEPRPPERIAEAACDVFAPCALGGAIGLAEVERLRCRIVAGSANNPLSDAAVGPALHRRGILYAPDFAISAGAVIQGAEWLRTGGRASPGRIAGIARTLGEVFDHAARLACPPEQAAESLAWARVTDGSGPDAGVALAGRP